MAEKWFRYGCRCLAALLVGNFVGLSPVLAAELKDIQQRGYLVVAVKDNLRPLGFKNATGQLEGLEIEIAQRLSQELLTKPNALRLEAVSNSARLSAVMEGQADLAIARVTANASRARLVNFSIPYYMDGTALVTKDERVRRAADLAGQTVAVLDASSTIATIRYRLPQVKLVGVESYEAAHALLETGKAVAFAADVSLLTGWVQEFPQYRLLPDRLSVEPLCVVLPNGVQYDSLRRRVNEAIAQWQLEGWLQQRATYWGLPWGNLDGETSNSTLPSDQSDSL